MNQAQRSAQLDSRARAATASGADPTSTCYSATGLPAGLSMCADGRIIGLVDGPGRSTVTLTVDDGDGAPRVFSFTWVVF